MTTLKTKDISRSGLADYKKLFKAHLVVIDDIMMIATHGTVAFKNQ